MSACTAWGQGKDKIVIEAKIDPRVELLSIMARLAHLEGYNEELIKPYVRDVHQYFDKDSLHPAILLMKELETKAGLSYDALMDMALHLSYPSFTPKINFTDQLPDERWTREGAIKFAPLALQFYKDTKFDQFFNAHKDLYDTAQKRFSRQIEQADFSWYKKFYGNVPKESFGVYLGLLNGRISYGGRTNDAAGHSAPFAVITTIETDDAGYPVYSSGNLTNLIHEFNHSFINYLIDRDSASLMQPGSTIYSLVKSQMERNLYGKWTIALNESIVRAAVIQYKIDHNYPSHEVRENVLKETGMGFYWIEDIITLLSAYEKNRDKYPTFESYVPVIESFLFGLADRIEKKYDRYHELFPRIIAVKPFENGATDVDPAIDQLVLIFSKPMKGTSFLIPKSGKEHYPLESVMGWDATFTQLTIKVKLKPHTDYELPVTGVNFRTMDNYPLENITLKFRTR